MTGSRRKSVLSGHPERAREPRIQSPAWNNHRPDHVEVTKTHHPPTLHPDGEQPGHAPED